MQQHFHHIYRVSRSRCMFLLLSTTLSTGSACKLPKSCVFVSAKILMSVWQFDTNFACSVDGFGRCILSASQIGSSRNAVISPRTSSWSHDFMLCINTVFIVRKMYWVKSSLNASLLSTASMSIVFLGNGNLPISSVVTTTWKFVFGVYLKFAWLKTSKNTTFRIFPRKNLTTRRIFALFVCFDVISDNL